MIKSTRDEFSARQGKFNLAERLANRLPAARSLGKEHLYTRQHAAAKLLLREGRVVMACVAEADPRLMEEGGDICEASVVYSFDEIFDDLPSLLAETAVRVSSLRELDAPDEAQRDLIAVLDGSAEKRLNVPLPRDLSYDKECFLTTVFVYRPHLPVPLLYRGFFPILVCPEKAESAMVLPAHYWSKELTAAWLEERK